MLEFGKPKREITDPGLHYKVPFIQNVEYFDKRILDIDTASQEVIASDQKRLVVDAFARYRITDPLLFFQSVRDERIANSRLGAILEASLRRVLGSASFADVVRDQREARRMRLPITLGQNGPPRHDRGSCRGYDARPPEGFEAQLNETLRHVARPLRLATGAGCAKKAATSYSTPAGDATI